MEASTALKQAIIADQEDAHAVIPGGEAVAPDKALDALWQTWLSVTSDLMDQGFTPHALCDGVNRTFEVRDRMQAGERQTA